MSVSRVIPVVGGVSVDFWPIISSSGDYNARKKAERVIGAIISPFGLLPSPYLHPPPPCYTSLFLPYDYLEITLTQAIIQGTSLRFCKRCV